MAGKERKIIQFPSDKVKKPGGHVDLRTALSPHSLIVYDPALLVKGEDHEVQRLPSLPERYNRNILGLVKATQFATMTLFPSGDALRSALGESTDDVVLEELLAVLENTPYEASFTQWIDGARRYSRELVQDVRNYRSTVEEYFVAPNCSKQQIKLLIALREQGVSFRRLMLDLSETLARYNPQNNDHYPEAAIVPTRGTLDDALEQVVAIEESVRPMTQAFMTIRGPQREDIEQVQLKIDQAAALQHMFGSMAYDHYQTGWISANRTNSDRLVHDAINYYSNLAPLTVLTPQKDRFWTFFEEAKQHGRTLLERTDVLKRSISSGKQGEWETIYT